MHAGAYGHIRTGSVVGRNADSLIRSTIKEILENGDEWISSDYSMNRARPLRELANVHLVLEDVRGRCSRSTVLPDLFNPGLAAARFLFLISGSNRTSDISFYTTGVRRFSDDGLVLSGSYGSRIFCADHSMSQFDEAVKLIQKRGDTKRAAIAIFQATDCGRETADVPCCLSIVFSPRKEYLSATTVMRANDCVRLLPYNIFEFSLLAEYVALLTDRQVGPYHHVAVSMHARGSDIFQAVGVLNENVHAPRMGPMPNVSADTRTKLVDWERCAKRKIQKYGRNGLLEFVRQVSGEVDPFWADLLVAAAIQGYYTSFSTEVSQSLESFIVQQIDIPDSFTLTNLLVDFTVAKHLPHEGEDQTQGPE